MNDIHKKLSASDAAMRARSDAIVQFSRSLVPTLRDAGREHSAKELERLLFEHDAAVGEASNLLRDNVDAIISLFQGGRP